jgi:hypothetical protein
MRRTALSLALVLALATAACSDKNGAATNQSTNGTGSTPNACTLLTAQRLAELLGTDPGQGDPQSVSPDRSVCIYANNVITAVEIAANYEASRRLVEENGSTTTDIPGVGSAAFFDSNGQVVAKGNRYFVAVTFSGPKEKLTEAARELLAAAEAAT